MICRQWLPGCGPRLLCAQFEMTEKTTQINEDTGLPSFYMPCTELTTNSFFPYLNPLTQCGELTPHQIFALYNLFVNFSDFEKANFSQKANEFHDRQRNKVVIDDDDIVDES